MNLQHPGVVVCPNCQHNRWASGRGFAAWACVILTFPVGLLLLLLFKPEHRCRGCGYRYEGGRAPVDPAPAREGPIARAVLGTIIFAVIAFLVWAVFVTASR